MWNKNFRDMLCELNAAAVEYLVIGAYAVAVHAEPRATGDIDFWVRPTPENARRVMRALAAFGAPLFDLREEDLATPGIVFQIGLPPERIDILTAIAGVDFDEAWATRVSHTVDGVSVNVLGRDALLKNKRAAGRPKDLADVAALEGRAEQRARRAPAGGTRKKKTPKRRR